MLLERIPIWLNHYLVTVPFMRDCFTGAFWVLGMITTFRQNYKKWQEWRKSRKNTAPVNNKDLLQTHSFMDSSVSRTIFPRSSRSLIKTRVGTSNATNQTGLSREGSTLTNGLEAPYNNVLKNKIMARFHGKAVPKDDKQLHQTQSFIDSSASPAIAPRHRRSLCKTRVLTSNDTSQLELFAKNGTLENIRIFTW